MDRMDTSTSGDRTSERPDRPRTRRSRDGLALALPEEHQRPGTPGDARCPKRRHPDRLAEDESLRHVPDITPIPEEAEIADSDIVSSPTAMDDGSAGRRIICHLCVRFIMAHPTDEVETNDDGTLPSIVCAECRNYMIVPTACPPSSELPPGTIYLQRAEVNLFLYILTWSLS